MFYVYSIESAAYISNAIFFKLGFVFKVTLFCKNYVDCHCSSSEKVSSLVIMLLLLLAQCFMSHWPRTSIQKINSDTFWHTFTECFYYTLDSKVDSQVTSTSKKKPATTAPKFSQGRLLVVEVCLTVIQPN